MDRFSAMKSFIRVVESGSFSSAARHLDIGQPAISKSIARLEQRLGVRLLVRSTRGFMPTDAGQKFYEQARRVVEAVDDAERAARGAGADLTGHLRISAPVSFANRYIVPRLPVFLDAHPGLSLELMLDDRAIDLIGEGVDVAIRIGTLRDSSMTARKLVTSRCLVLGSPCYFERMGTPKTPTDLNNHSAIIYTHEGGGDTWSFSQNESEVSVRTSSRLRVTANEGVRIAVINGLGLTIASEWVFAPELASGAVRAVLTDWTLPASDAWVVFPAGRMISAKARAFVAFAEAELRRCGRDQRSPRGLNGNGVDGGDPVATVRPERDIVRA